MPAPQNFRSAFNGFNREDVVKYLEYINTKHTAQVNQLTSEADYLRSRLENGDPQSEETVAALEQERDELRAQLEEMTARCAELEAALAERETEAESPCGPAAELEAYRRAERAEREAKERAELVYHQISGVLADATTRVDSVAADVSSVADQVMQQLSQLQAAVVSSKLAMQDAASTLYAIRPNEK